MNTYARTGAVLSLALLGAGCDFLTGPGLTENPNSPTGATPTAQFVAVQANMFARMEGQLARFAGIFTQQLIGSNNQQQAQGTQYLVTEGDVSGFMSAFYTGGGLVGLRKVQEAANAAGDAQWEGIAKIWEAYAFGTAASLWGDLPYREANNPTIVTPQLDPQLQLYTDILALLDEGITLIGGAGPGPGPADLIYGGNVDRWRRAAYTLKARFLLHLVEQEGNARYLEAITAANQGINEAPATPADAMHGRAPGDFRTLHGSVVNVDANIWAQFLAARQDIVAGHELVAMLKARSDPRLTAYFNANSGGSVWGMNADGAVVVTAPTSDSSAAVVNTAVRRANNFRQPLVTWVENQLILAEAKFMTGDSTGAVGHVDAVRTAVGMPALGAVSFADIMQEKYIAMFQNIDVWSHFKRACTPLVKPYLATPEVLGRLPYGLAERTNNPNVPLASAQPARNWNDPVACPRP